jgi:hypothetical protein
MQPVDTPTTECPAWLRNRAERRTWLTVTRNGRCADGLPPTLPECCEWKERLAGLPPLRSR